MDEPLSNLDAKLRESLRVELTCLRRRLRTPMLYVTHDQVEALSMADRIVVLSRGKVLQIGTPEEIYRSPSSPSVALQLGRPPVNLFTVRSIDGFWVTEQGLPLMEAEGEAGGEAVAGVRPEDIRAAGGDRPAKVRVVEETGAARILLIGWAGQDVHILSGRDARVKAGDTVFPSVDADRVVLWEK
ncbi:hypothetical protein ACFLSJ_05765 [Verrucomicrobiota bacterium]